MTTPTHVACKYYFWKPMLALFRAVELEVYLRAGVKLASPTLDLGCGEGRPMQMLRDLHLADGVTVGLDFSLEDLRKGRSRGAHHHYVNGDALHLPFADETFASIVCNNLFSSMPNFSVQAVEELRRVLRPGGLAVVTVALDRFMDMLTVPKLLARISHGLANRYVRKTNERLPHYKTFSSDEWRNLLVKVGLEVVRVEPYFSPRVGAMWNILFLQVFRLFGLLRPMRSAELRIAPILERVFERTVTRERSVISTVNPDFGYILVLARRPHLRRALPDCVGGSRLRSDDDRQVAKGIDWSRNLVRSNSRIALASQVSISARDAYGPVPDAIGVGGHCIT